LRNANHSLVHNINSVYGRYELPDFYYLRFTKVVGLPDFLKRFATGLVKLLGLRRLLNHTHALRKMTPERIDNTISRKAEFVRKIETRW